MKTVILSVILAFIMLNVNGQVNKDPKNSKIPFKVPDIVQNTFTSKFPKASKVKWGFEKKGNYEADFSMNEHDVTAIINKKGILLETDTELKESELPQSIKTKLSNEFKGYKVDEVNKIEAKAITTYKMQAKNDKLEFDLVFDKNGKILKKDKFVIDD